MERKAEEVVAVNASAAPQDPVDFELLFEQQQEEARKKRQKIEEYLEQEEPNIWHPTQQRALERGPSYATSTLKGYPRPSEQIYVLGTDKQGQYIAHQLAGCMTIPPIRYLIHSPYVWNKWVEGDRRLRLYRGDDATTDQSRVIGEFISKRHEPRPSGAELPFNGPIENLIITLPAHELLHVLPLIRHRLDHRSTICLAQDGLGIAEFLVETLFTDPLTRPSFLLAHTTHALAYVPREKFAISEVRQGRFYLTGYRPLAGARGQRVRIIRHPPIERTDRVSHLLRILTATPGLKATGHPVDDFFREKLPVTAFRAAADPITAIMNCPYDKIPGNSHARLLFNSVLSEICEVSKRLPVAKNSQKLNAFMRDGMLGREAFHKLKRQRSATSSMRHDMSWGDESDIDFLTGYFIKCAREVNVKTTALETVLTLFKAAHATRRDERKAEIPYEEQEALEQ